MSQFLLGHNVQTHNNSLPNLVRGVGERVLYTSRKLCQPITPIPGIFIKRCASYRTQLLNDLSHQSPVTMHDFVGYYRGPRQLIYQKAVDSLQLLAARPRDAHLKTFVKAEKLNFTIKDDPAPRVIQPRSPRYNVVVGRYLRPLEPRIYKSIDKLFGAPTIMSSYNSFTSASILRQKWDEYRQPVCVGLDASRFDQHVSVQALEFEHSIYNSLCRSKELAQLLRWQITNYGVASCQEGWFSYVKHGSRMSGDMNTSMGNKLLMCLMAKSYIDTKRFKISFVNNGDDCLLITERKNLKCLTDLESYFQDFGFNIKREKPVYDFEQVEFCQTQPILSNGKWRMVRNVRTALTKDVTVVNLGHDVARYRMRLREISKCGLAYSADIPIFGAFYRMLGRFGIEGNSRTGCEYDSHTTLSKGAYCVNNNPDQIARYSFYVATGISPDEQIQAENYFDCSVWGGDNRQIIDFDLHTLINGKTRYTPSP